MDKCEQFFKAMSDETRLKILKALEKKKMCVSDIAKAFNVSQPAISHHLNILKVAGLVVNERKGQEVYYSFDKDWFRKCCGDYFSMFECCKDFFEKYKIVKKIKKGGGKR